MDGFSFVFLLFWCVQKKRCPGTLRGFEVRGQVSEAVSREARGESERVIGRGSAERESFFFLFSAFLKVQSFFCLFFVDRVRYCCFSQSPVLF